MGTVDSFSWSTFVMSDTNEDPAYSLHFNSSQRCSVRLRSVKSSSTPNLLNHVLWTLLCALVRSHVGTGSGHFQTVLTKFEQSVLACWNKSSFQWNYWKEKEKKKKRHNSPLHQTLHLALCSRQVLFSWRLPNPDSSIRLTDWEAWFVTPGVMSPLI